MKKLMSAVIFTGIIAFSSCNQSINAQTNNLAVTEYANELKKNPEIQLIDVRTPEEFADGHLENAVNIDWNSKSFDKLVSTLDKKKPVFVYCLSGGRSEKAANKLTKIGFLSVTNLAGGMMKWRGENLPEVKGQVAQNRGMDTAEYETLIGNTPVLLVDFYADWCAPCKKMKPYLDEIDKKMSKEVKVLRINVDKNKHLVNNLGIDALPVLRLYKNKNLVWNKQGFVPKEEVLKKLAEIKK
ncbi:thioredoxin domain-containing protein [Amniculibacterium sp. G2-70]|uniref:thioredoxin domain-containing protein n=1 Tax=Amniculibacterium sp. G2-70 TaxID=2767188 RepID=UPI0016541994|nr:thioredoxin domain-containing protein [Amniculibacterium sp. G2-70]